MSSLSWIKGKPHRYSVSTFLPVLISVIVSICCKKKKISLDGRWEECAGSSCEMKRDRALPWQFWKSLHLGAIPPAQGIPCIRVPGNFLHIVTLQLSVTTSLQPLCIWWWWSGSSPKCASVMEKGTDRNASLSPSHPAGHLNANRDALPGRGYLICLGMSRSHLLPWKII